MNARSRRLRFFSLALAVLGLCMVLLCGCRPAEEKADSSPAELPVIVVGSDNYRRQDEYTWAGPYLHSRQVVAVRTSSDIYTLADLADKTLVVQSTTKPEKLFLDAAANGLPQLRAVYSLQDRDLIYTTLIKGYADALAAHESAIRQFMKDYSVEYRILAEPLMQADLGVAFAKDRADDLPQRLTETFREMLADGTTREIVSRYLDEPDHYLEGMGGSSDD